MATYEVKRRESSSNIRVFDEGRLRYSIRKVSLSGTELVRTGPNEPWIPLHTLPLFREEATGAANATDTGVLARARSDAFKRFIGFMTMGGLLGVATGIVALGGNTGATTVVGGISLAMVVAGWVAGMALAIKHGARSTGRPRKVSTEAPDALAKALASLETALAQASDDVRRSVDLADVRGGIAAARRKRTLLAAIHHVEDPRPALLADLATAKARAAATTDASAADAFADEIRSIEGLLDSMDRAARAAAESEARERALLNELEALRLAVLSANTGAGTVNAVTDHLASVRGQLQEEAAIESDLANDFLATSRRLDPQKN